MNLLRKLAAVPILRFAVTVGILASSLTIYPNITLAVPFEIDVLDSTYTTLVSNKTVLFLATEPPFVNTTETISREITSSTPHSDYLESESSLPELFGPELFGPNVAAARADLFEISAFTAAQGHDEDVSIATATSQISFSPVVDGLASIMLEFIGEFEWFFSEGAVSLFDATLGQDLWTFGWECCISNSSVPWVSDFQPPFVTATAALTLDTFFLSAHTYEFSMSTTTNSNPPDSERITIRASGLEPVTVPEPGTLALFSIGLAGMGLASRRRRRKAI